MHVYTARNMISQTALTCCNSKGNIPDSVTRDAAEKIKQLSTFSIYFVECLHPRERYPIHLCDTFFSNPLKCSQKSLDIQKKSLTNAIGLTKWARGAQHSLDRSKLSTSELHMRTCENVWLGRPTLSPGTLLLFMKELMCVLCVASV